MLKTTTYFEKINPISPLHRIHYPADSSKHVRSPVRSPSSLSPLPKQHLNPPLSHPLTSPSPNTPKNYLRHKTNGKAKISLREEETQVEAQRSSDWCQEQIWWHLEAIQACCFRSRRPRKGLSRRLRRVASRNCQSYQVPGNTLICPFLKTKFDILFTIFNHLKLQQVASMLPPEAFSVIRKSFDARKVSLINRGLLFLLAFY